MHQSVAKAGVAPDLNGIASFPSVVEIQTHGRCNAACSCCPYDSVSESTRANRMSDELLAAILDECATNRHRIAQLVPYHNNEPFLDVRMLDILRFIRTRIEVPVELSTNVSALTPSTIASLVTEALASTLRVSFFGATRETYEARMKLPFDRATKNLRNLLEASRNSSVDVEVVMIASGDLTQTEVDLCRSMWEPLGAKVNIFGYLDRAGTSSEINFLPFAARKRPVVGCDLNRPFERMCILSDGSTVICSQDWLRETNLGNVRDDGIAAVWNGNAYAALRATMRGTGAFASDFLCRRCKLAIFE